MNSKYTTISIVLVGLIIASGIILTNSKEMPMQKVAQQQPNSIDEKTFLLNMIPHHQEAVDTANEVLDRGGVIPEVKTLVQNIITAQEKEIADMKLWYKQWYGEEYADTNMYRSMMRELETLSGRSIDLVFTNDMIMHHMGAMHLAQAVLQNTEREELITLGNNILVTQREEMVLMREILANNK